MRCDENKKVLPLLASFTITNIPSKRILIATCSKDVQCNRNLDLDELILCIHEEVDQGLFLYAKRASKRCYILSFENGKHRFDCQ